MSVSRSAAHIFSTVAATLVVVGHPMAQPAPQERTVTVLAAASLTGAFQELADSFEHAHPGVRVRLDFAGTPSLVLQIEQGGAADVFASADTHWMDVVRDSGWVASPVVFAHNNLVLIAPVANPAHIGSMRDLARHGVKLVVADSAVPVGHYARTAFDRLGATPGIPIGYAANVRRNIVSNEDNVKGVVAKVELGEADAGIVYRTDAAAAAAHLRVLPLPAVADVVADYPIAVLRHSREPELARAFIALLLSPTGTAILQRAGFAPAASAH